MVVHLGSFESFPFTTGLCIAALLLSAWLVLRPKGAWQRARRPAHFRSVAIVVLGDIGRSPRMMYHAESFANNGFETFLIGYEGSPLNPSLLSMPHVREMYLAEPPSFISKLPRKLFLVLAPFKVALQVITILHTLLFRMPYPPEFILVQNPPTIPTLALVQLVAWLHSCKVIIDWHNLGYTILGMRLGEKSKLVQFAKWFESTFGKHAFAHLFVTNAMKNRLTAEWDLRGQKAVLHDRPPAHFHASEPTEVHDLFNRLTFPFLGDSFLPDFLPPMSTPLTKLQELDSTLLTSPTFGHTSLPRLREDRPAVLVSSTSWTPDEDFSILLEALNLYEERARAVNEQATGAAQRLPKLLVIITGKGPLKERYQQEIEALEKHWEWIRCPLMWLAVEDYPILLGSADLGVSLHSSSSALDLPMKIVDMFGCGLPVCALDFACLAELVKDGENGLVFSSAQQLAKQLEDLLLAFPDSPPLTKLRTALEHNDRRGTWQENWDKIVKPIITHRVVTDK